MKNYMLAYIKQNSTIHRLTGATKLICFLIWSLATMFTYDTRILAAMFIISLIFFRISKIKFKEISFVLYFILFFLLLNNLAIFAFSPLEGVHIYHTRHNIFHIAGGYYITAEQLFYQLNITLKYFAVIPIALLFIVTTDPSEFSASLNKIGVNYKIAYAVSIALRYIPDVQRDYQNISYAQQARGMDMSKNEKLSKRIKNATSILIPLIFSSLDRIEIVSCAMELRGFGNKKKRSWYRFRAFLSSDFIAIIFVFLLLIISLTVTVTHKSRFYNPFI